MSEDCLDEHYVVFLIIFLVRRNRVSRLGGQVYFSRGSGHTIACLVGFRVFALAGLDRTRGGGMVSGISAAGGGDPIMLVVRDAFHNRVRIVIRVVWVGDTVCLSVGKVHCRSHLSDKSSQVEFKFGSCMKSDAISSLQLSCFVFYWKT